MKNKPIIQKLVLGAVIINNGNALILQRHKNETVFPNMWELPSGKREALEPTEDALLREVKEETGLDVEIIIPVSVFDYQIEKKEEIRDSTQINFLVRCIYRKPSVMLSAEHQAFAWINEGGINDYELTEATRKVLKKAFRLAKQLFSMFVT